MEHLTVIKTFVMKKSTQLFLGGMLAMGLFIMIFSPLIVRSEIIRKECNQQKTHCFVAARYHKLFSSEIIFHVGTFVEGGSADYAHSIEYPFPDASGVAASNDEIKKASVEFSEDGIAYTHPTNHVLFIPKSAYY